MSSKTCRQCADTKPITDFYTHPNGKDGRLNRCKACICSNVSARRHGEGRAKVLAYERERAKTPARRDRMEAIVARWKEQFPQRRAAQVALNNAVRDGRVEKWPLCAVPECNDAPEAHHVHYDLPLDVVWLCPSHHKQAHAMTRAAGS